MARKKSRDDWRKKRRQEYLETREYRYYIFTEGVQTEPLYFQRFKDLIEENPIYKDMVLVKLEPCGVETERVVDQARNYVRDNRITKGQIWCVYDKDSFPAAHFNYSSFPHVFVRQTVAFILAEAAIMRTLTIDHMYDRRSGYRLHQVAESLDERLLVTRSMESFLLFREPT